VNAEELKDTVLGIKLLLNYLANMPAGLWGLSIILTILLVWALQYEIDLSESMFLGAVLTVPCIIVLAIGFLFSFLATEKSFIWYLGQLFIYIGAGLSVYFSRIIVITFLVATAIGSLIWNAPKIFNGFW